MTRSAWPMIAIVGALLLLAVGSAGGSAGAQGGTADGDTVRIELRVLQELEDDLGISVSARPADGSWRTLGVIALPLDDGHSSDGRYRYGDVTLEVPLSNRATPARIEMRVWQHVENGRRIYLSARPQDGSWATLGTIALPLDGGVDSLRGLRYGEASIEAPLPEDEVSTLAGRAGVRGYRDGQGDGALFGRFGADLGLGVEIDHDGNVIVADRQNRAIRRITPDGTVSTIAGGNGRGVRDGPAAEAQFAGPTDVAIAPDGTIYVADSYGHRIRKIAPDGMVATVAGGGPIYGPPFGEGAWGSFRDGHAAEARFAFPHGIALGRDGNLFVAQDSRRIRRISPSGDVSTHAGSGYGHRDGHSGEALFNNLLAIDVDAEGNIYVIDNHSRGIAIRKVDTAGVVSTLRRGALPGRGGTLASPRGLAVADDGAIYVANTGRHQLLELTPGGILRAVAGTGEPGYADGPRAEAMFNLPGAIAVRDDGRLVVADEGNNLIRTIVPQEAGSSRGGQTLATAGQLPRLEGIEVTLFASGALLRRPEGMALDLEGNVIVADSRRHAVLRVSPRGTVTTIAGGRREGLRDGFGRNAQFSRPEGVAVHQDGSIYVADSGNNRIRRIAPDGSVTTAAGGGPPSTEGNWGGYRDGPASEARFRGPGALAFDGAGNLIIVDWGNSRIRLLSADGEVSTIAGAAPIPAPDRHQGNHGSRDGPGSRALFHWPRGIALDGEGGIFFAEGNNAIRRIDSSGFVSTVLRTPSTRYGGALSGALVGIARGNDGALYVTDGHYMRVIRVSRDGEVSIVADRGFGIIVTLEGDLLVSDASGVIWTIALGDGTEAAAE
ncbi:MAG: hypothetical protein OXC94_03875 [Chloroflexi bacterium]|nr:hypothetical protein [Chloroflexota bacterium]